MSDHGFNIDQIHAAAGASGRRGMSEKQTKCLCHMCQEERDERQGGTLGIPLRWPLWNACACGNKRCPKATDHRLQCTGSNDPGQPGSIYGGISK
jgi:hypothetical protein